MSLNLPILEGTYLIDVLGLKTYEVDNPKTFSKLRDISNYFKNVPNARYKILKVLSDKHGDKMDILWTYVALKNEQAEMLRQLNPEHFPEDIAEQITDGYVTKAARQRIQDDIENRLKEEEKNQDQKVDKAMVKIQESLPHTKEALDRLNILDKELQAYE